MSGKGTLNEEAALSLGGKMPQRKEMPGKKHKFYRNRKEVVLFFCFDVSYSFRDSVQIKIQ